MRRDRIWPARRPRPGPEAASRSISRIMRPCASRLATRPISRICSADNSGAGAIASAGTFRTSDTPSTRKPVFPPADRQHENALLASGFRRGEVEAPPQIDDRDHVAAQVHHAVDEGGRLGQPRDVLGRPRDLVDRADRQAVFLIAEPEDDELLVRHASSTRLSADFVRGRPARPGPGAPGRSGTADPGDSTATRRLPPSRRQIEVISASPSPRVSSAGAGSITRGIDATGFPGCGPPRCRPRRSPSTRPRPCRARALIVGFGRPSSARSDTSGSKRSRSVTTPSTAVSARGISAICSGSGMISRTRSSGSAYSWRPSSKLTNSSCRCAGAIGRAVVAAATDAGARARAPETPSRANSIAQQPLRIQVS